MEYDDEEEDDEPEQTPPPRSRTKRKAAPPLIEYDDEEEDDEPEQTPPPRSHTKRKTAPSPVEYNEEGNQNEDPKEQTKALSPSSPPIREEYQEIFDPANEEEDWLPTSEPTPTVPEKSIFSTNTPLFPKSDPPQLQQQAPKVKTKKKTVSTVTFSELEEGSNNFPELETTPALEISVPVTDEEAEEEEPVSCMNIMQSIVEPKLDHFIRINGVCTCQRCRVDVMALALSNLPARYVVVTDQERTPMLSLLENEYAADAMQQIMIACQRVKANPHHKRKK